MFTTIAWATDGSASASEALPVAEGLARAGGGKLVIIHVQEVTISRSGLLTEDSRAVLAALHRTVRRLRDGGVHATVLWSRTTTRNAGSANRRRTTASAAAGGRRPQRLT